AIELDSNTNSSLVNIQALHGHDGVIFSLDYSFHHNTLISASDDRSIRIWTGSGVKTCEADVLNMQFWKENTFQLAHVYYGHASRIWKVASLHQAPIVISAGEDSSIFVWSLSAPYRNIKKTW